MPIKAQLRLGCSKLALGHKFLLQRRLTTSPGGSVEPLRGVLGCKYRSCPTVCASHMSRRFYADPPSVQKDSLDGPKWSTFDIKLDIQQCEDKPEELSLPALVYLYGPWKLLSTKWNFWKLKFLWDLSFVESKFMENSKQAAVVLTDMIRHHTKTRIERCTTPMGFKQINHDLFHDWRIQLMRFDQCHIRRCIPLKVQLLRHYDHKFAFIDVIFVALRRTDDFRSSQEQCEIESLIDIYANHIKYKEEAPLIFSEIFVRFRRDYSMDKNRSGGQWLVSSYKILQFDIVQYHPEYEIPATVHSELPTNDDCIP
ncbi:uncharacterized protein LOC6639751 [Drosophila willistoni]|nr:uncharacterized protein LOC6639751 [Drosophila willistoni]